MLNNNLPYINKVFCTLLMCTFVALAQADIIVLQTGQTIQGTILIENEQAVVIQSDAGTRFQYMKSDIQSITRETEDAQPTAVVDQQTEPTTKKTTNAHPVSFLLELSGGGVSAPAVLNGGTFDAEILIGSRMIANRHIFIGGGVGYFGYFSAQPAHFFALEAATRIPLLEGKHSPQVGASLGYGFSLTDKHDHGVHAGVDVGYRYQKNKKTAVYIGLNAHIQQSSVELTETFNNAYDITSTFTRKSGATLIGYGLKFGLVF